MMAQVMLCDICKKVIKQNEMPANIKIFNVEEQFVVTGETWGIVCQECAKNIKDYIYKRSADAKQLKLF